MDPVIVATIVVGSTFTLLSLFMFGVARVLQMLDYDVYD
jgi:hypothetical protein